MPKANLYSRSPSLTSEGRIFFPLKSTARIVEVNSGVLKRAVGGPVGGRKLGVHIGVYRGCFSMVIGESQYELDSGLRSEIYQQIPLDRNWYHSVIMGGNALITRRSVVQIHPPLPVKSMGYGDQAVAPFYVCQACRASRRWKSSTDRDDRNR